MCAPEPDKPDIGQFDGREFLSFLKSCGIVLAAGPGGKIRFDAPAGMFTAELRAAVAEHRAELLELLASGPQDLQPHDDAAGPSGTDRPAGQPLPCADPLGAAGPQDDRGDAGQAHGAAPVATDGPRTRPAAPVAVEWPAAAADIALLLAVDDLPPVPFPLNPWTEVRNAAKFLRWLQADIRRGPSGPRAFYGALQADIRTLTRFALAAADDRQRNEN